MKHELITGGTRSSGRRFLGRGAGQSNVDDGSTGFHALRRAAVCVTFAGLVFLPAQFAAGQPAVPGEAQAGAGGAISLADYSGAAEDTPSPWLSMHADEIVFGLLTMVFGALIGKLLEPLELPAIGKDRRTALTGTWLGWYFQKPSPSRPRPEPVRIHCFIVAGYRRVTGAIRGDDARTFYFSFQGTFTHSRYLRFSYGADGPTSNALDFGTCLLVLNDEGTSLVGNLIGWGSISQNLISGGVELSKQSPGVPKSKAMFATLQQEAPKSEIA